jgi:hypothetical protein
MIIRPPTFAFQTTPAPGPLLEELEKFFVYWLGPSGPGYGEPESALRGRMWIIHHRVALMPDFRSSMGAMVGGDLNSGATMPNSGIWGATIPNSGELFSMVSAEPQHVTHSSMRSARSSSAWRRRRCLHPFSRHLPSTPRVGKLASQAVSTRRLSRRSQTAMRMLLAKE